MARQAVLTREQLHLKCFQYCPKDAAMTWYMNLRPGSLVTWSQVCKVFFNKYFPTQKAKDLRLKIASFFEEDGEPFHEACERFNLLLAQMPPHTYNPELKVNSFYSGLSHDHTNASGQCVRRRIEVGQDTQVQNQMSRMNKELQSIKELITGKPGSSQGLSQVMGEIEGEEEQFGQEEQAQAPGEFPRPRNDPGTKTSGYNRYNQGGPSNNNQWGSSSSNPQSNFNSQASTSQQKDKSLEEIVSTVIKTVDIGSEALKTTLHAFEQRMTAYMQSNDQRENSHGESLKKMETQLAQIFDSLV
ncbi:hypothetical protein Dsin_032041 [Dipteronia sinensis]|uniref:Retrotransposon gag domain-containing protein n=1 Tax=Dipteronia sinensis TaxID=43782 RepID=A0AAD9ZNI8_9ROSI|nr:hypothetical protein Dsin_032041 [Dipteronia sinensis]